MVTYEQWNKAILSYFFEECEPNQIVFLETNEETLADIAAFANFNIPDAAESLKRAVKDKVVFGHQVRLLPIRPNPLYHPSADAWEKEPPQVAFLALSVLAASFMDAEGHSISPHNYYIRLNEVLFGELIPNAPHGFNRSDFGKLWKHLQQWAQEHYEVELHLSEGPSNRKYVWYPISQCLISKHDRRAVYRFFRNEHLTPFTAIPEKQLAVAFRRFLASSAVVSAPQSGVNTLVTKMTRYLSHEAYKESILRQVKSLLTHWDGHIPPALSDPRHTRAAIAVGLRFDPVDNDNLEIRYWLPRRGRSDIDCKSNLLGIERLQTSALEKWFRPVPDDKDTFWQLTEPLQLQTDETHIVIYTLSPSDIWVFREDSERDDNWISQRNMQLYEEHLIVCRKEQAHRVINCLKQTYTQESEKPRPVRVRGNQWNGWLYLRVKPTQLWRCSDPELWHLSVESSKQMRLIGGLSAKDRDGRRGYLDCCLPTVFVPELGFPDSEPLKVDSQELPIGADRLVSLENTLEPGVHQMSYGRQTRELRVITPERSAAHQNQTLTAALSKDTASLPTYAVKKVPELAAAPGLWLAGAKFFGANIPETTWDDVREPPSQENDDKVKSPADLLSSVVKVAIALKKGDAEVPAWCDTALEHLEQNVALRALVEKKLRDYRGTALSYAELCARVSARGGQ